VEAIIALLLTVGLACLIGFRRGGDKASATADVKALDATYGEYLLAVSAAGLVRLSNALGDPPAPEDIKESRRGPRLIGEILKMLEGEQADAVIEVSRRDPKPTVKALLTGIAGDAEKYWPDHSGDVHRACDSLR
jgi:hypothetical protein